MDNIFRGFGIALVTPFAEDGSKIELTFCVLLALRQRRLA